MSVLLRVNLKPEADLFKFWSIAYRFFIICEKAYKVDFLNQFKILFFFK